MHGDIGEDPGAGTTAAAKLRCDIDARRIIHFEAAPSNGKKNSIEASVEEILLGYVWDATVNFGLMGSLAQNWNHVPGA